MDLIEHANSKRRIVVLVTAFAAVAAGIVFSLMITLVLQSDSGKASSISDYDLSPYNASASFVAPTANMDEFADRAEIQASSANLLPPMTMVYEVYGPSISVGERSIEPFKELRRLEYQSETEWVETVIESPSVDRGRYGVGSNVGSYTRLDGRAIDEYDAMVGSTEESAVSEDSIFVPNSAFAYALATPNSMDDTPGLSKSQVVSSATVCFNGDCEENARGVLYSGDGFELVMLMNDSWGIPLRLGDGFLVREIEIQVAKQ